MGILEAMKIGTEPCKCFATVLIVEDNLYNVVPVKMILRQSYDIALERAANGLEGIQMFKKDLDKKCCDVHYQIILMDINMPIMNGIDSTKGICKIQEEFYSSPAISEIEKIKCPRAPILAMTAFSNKKTVAQCKQAGMIGILYKPVCKKGFEEQVRKSLNVEFLQYVSARLKDKPK